MAKKRRRTASASTKIIRVGGSHSPAPIIRVSTPRAAAPAKRRRRSGGRRSGGHSIGGGIVSSETLQMAIGGALYGFAVKSGMVAKLPAIPVLGRTGTAAILLDYWAKHGGGQMAHRAARAAAAIAGYQLGAEGAIQGDTADGSFAMGDSENANTPGSMAGDMDGYGDD